MPDGGAHAHVGARDPVRDGVVHGLVRAHFAAFAEPAQQGGRALPGYSIEGFYAFLPRAYFGSFRAVDNVSLTIEAGPNDPIFNEVGFLPNTVARSVVKGVLSRTTR